MSAQALSGCNCLTVGSLGVKTLDDGLDYCEGCYWTCEECAAVSNSDSVRADGHTRCKDCEADHRLTWGQ